MSTNGNRRALTLMELMVVLSITTILFGVFAMSASASRSGATVSSLAQIVAQELVAARLRANSLSETVAVVIPGANGTVPHSQSIYTMAGWPHPRIVAVRNYRQEFPAGYLCVGTYDTADNVSLAPALNTPPLNISNWLEPSTKDYVIAFGADGKVITNDLPWFSNGQTTELRVIACCGLSFTPAGTAPTGTPMAGNSTVRYFQFTGVWQAQTVCVSPTGMVSVEPGLKDAAASVVQEPGGSIPSLPPAAPPSMTSAANQPPVICRMDSLPAHSGSDSACIDSSGFVTIVARAVDPNDGDILSCNITATDSGGNAVGAWSQVLGGSQMCFDPNDANTTLGYPHGCWKSTWVWAPPQGLPAYQTAAGSEFRIFATVTDDRGASVTTTGNVQVVSVLVRDLGRVIFAGQYKGRSRLFSIAPQGTTPILITPMSWQYDCLEPCASPDGTKVLYIADPTGGTNTNIYMCNQDGSSNQLVLQATSAPLHHPAWFPTGAAFAYTEETATPWIRTAQVSGAGAPMYLAAGTQPRCSPLTGDIVYVDSGKNVTVIPISATQATPSNPVPAGVNVIVPYSAGVQLVYPSFDTMGKKVFYGDTTAGKICSVDLASGSVLIAPGSFPSIQGPVSFSPNNLQAVLAQSTNGTFVENSPAGFLGPTTLSLYPFGPSNTSIGYCNFPTWSK